MFDAKARVGSRNSLDGFGGGFAGRGQDVNTAIEEFVPLLSDLEPVATNLSDPETRLDNFFRSLGRAAEEVAPVAEEQAALFVNLDTTFTALAQVARPYIQETIIGEPAERGGRDPRLPAPAAVHPQQHRAVPRAQAGRRHAAARRPDPRRRVRDRHDVLPKTIQMNEDLADVFEALADFSEDPLVHEARLADAADLVAEADAEVHHAGPDHLQLRDAAAPQRGEPVLRRRLNGNWQRFIIVSAPTDAHPEPGPNNEGGPSDAPANGPGRKNHLHVNPYPNTAAPGQTQECEAGNEPYAAGRPCSRTRPATRARPRAGSP